MIDLLSSLIIEDGARPSPLEGVILLRAAKSSQAVPVLYEPCIVVVAQGRKRFHLPDHVLTYDAQRYLIVTVPVPADCETEVLAEGPFLGMAVRIDLDVLSDLLLKLGPDLPADKGEPFVRVTAPAMNSLVSDASVRLLESLTSPSDAKVLGPQLVREFLYRILCDANAGSALRHLLLGSEGRTQVHRILNRIHLDYSAPLDVRTLAHDAGMSSSALHLHFRAVTGTSPVQYLKTLRLHKARMLMVQTSLSAAAAAARVGYASPSQFSREFKRFFGTSPADEAQRVRAAFGFTDEVSAPT